MPVDKVQLVGDWEKKHSFTHKDDMRLLGSAKLTQRVQHAFRNVPVSIDIYFVNTTTGRNYTELGEVDPSFIFAKPDKPESGYRSDRKEGLGLDPAEVQLNDDAISVFFTNNKGAERFPMTPWIMAHRIGHVFQRPKRGGNFYAPSAYRDFAEQVEHSMGILCGCYHGLAAPPNQNGNAYQQRPAAYDGAIKQVGQAIGTMRSARTRSLRTGFEFTHELFAQYLISGKIKLNPPPRSIVTRFAWGNPVSAWMKQDRPDLAAQTVQQMLEMLPPMMEEVLSASIGRVYVM